MRPKRSPQAGTPWQMKRQSQALQQAISALDCRITVALPEGFLFYALFPELYCALGATLARVLAGVPTVVIGVRSIGTALSAALGAGLRAGGCPIQRHTVRPLGDPFAREVRPTAAQARAWRAAARRGAAFVVVDEGPGLSGSSLAAVVVALERLGVESSRIRIACAAPPHQLPSASPATRAVWQRTRWWAVGDDDDAFWHATLPALLGEALGRTARVTRDLSWGGWAALGGGAETPLLPRLERRKLLLTLDAPDAVPDDGGPRTRERVEYKAPGEITVVAKFIGFGAAGRQKARLNQDAAEAGLTPPVVAYAHGMLLQRWCVPSGAGAPAHQAGPPIVAAARYYAYLRRHCALDEPEAAIGEHLAEIAATVQEIARAWFGAAAPGDVRRALARLRGARRLHGDQRPEPVEWILHEAKVLKCDTSDHFLDHTWARAQDVCFDLAGFIQEFTLTGPQQQELIETYARESGDVQVGTRLPFYRAVYAAHRLAGLDMAYHANGSALGSADEQSRLDSARGRMAVALGDALRAIGLAACAS